MLDFAIIYEHKNRELETACLIKCLLEKKGYKCEVFYLFSFKRAVSNPKVIIYPYLYHTENCREANSFLIKKRRPIVNLQYEQVITKAAADSGFYSPKGDAKNAMHITWGESSTKRLLEDAGIDKEHIRQVGNISLTLNDTSFADFYVSRDEIAQEYNIPKESKWHIFVSSFTFVTVQSKKTAKLTKNSETEFVTNKGFLDVGRATRAELLRWFEDYCRKNENEVIIYRPHPNEFIDDELISIQNEVKNFRIISSGSIRQWIFLADSLLTWLSTSIADIFFAERTCLILRPIQVPETYDSEMLENCYTIKTEDEFFEKMNSKNWEFPVKPEKIRQYYCNISPQKVFSDFTDCCEYVYKNSEKYEIDPLDNSFYAILKYNALLSLGGRCKLYKITEGLLSDRLRYSYIENKNIAKLKKGYIKKLRKYLKSGYEVN